MDKVDQSTVSSAEGQVCWLRNQQKMRITNSEDDIDRGYRKPKLKVAGVVRKPRLAAAGIVRNPRLAVAGVAAAVEGWKLLNLGVEIVEGKLKGIQE